MGFKSVKTGILGRLGQFSETKEMDSGIRKGFL